MSLRASPHSAQLIALRFCLILVIQIIISAISLWISFLLLALANWSPTVEFAQLWPGLLLPLFGFSLSALLGIVGSWWYIPHPSEQTRIPWILRLLFLGLGFGGVIVLIGFFAPRQAAAASFGFLFVGIPLFVLLEIWLLHYFPYRSRPTQVASDDQSDTSLQLSIVVPAYNEELRIEKSLQIMLAYLSKQNFRYELTVVDDGSSDGTGNVVQALQKKHPHLQLIQNRPNRGKGFAVKTGVLAARGEYILFTDADNSTPIEEIAAFLPVLKTTQVVIGSRYLSQSHIVIRQPWYRRLLSRMSNLLIQALATPGIVDTQCGFKALERTAARDIFSRMQIDRFGFDFEMLSIARLRGYKIREMPVNWYDAHNSRVKFVRDGLRTLTELLRIKWNRLSGMYH